MRLTFLIAVAVVLALALRAFGLSAPVAVFLILGWMLLVPAAMFAAIEGILGSWEGVIRAMLYTAAFWFFGFHGNPILEFVAPGVTTLGPTTCSGNNFCP